MSEDRGSQRVEIEGLIEAAVRRAANPSNIPIPDPSAVTANAIQALREEIRRDITAVREIFDTRLAAMDKASILLAEHVIKCPSVGDVERMMTERQIYYNERFSGLERIFTEQLSGLKSQITEQFSGIKGQFDERDVRTGQASLAATTAVNAALQAQKEAAGAQNEANAAAITKSEAATKEKIDGLGALFKGDVGALRDQVAALTSRLDRGEGISRGSRDLRVEHRDQTDVSLKIVMVILAVAAIASPILFAALSSHNGGQGQSTPSAVAVVPIQPQH
jgi:hypothetical protein